MDITRAYTQVIATYLENEIGSDKVSIHFVKGSDSFWVIGKDHCIEVHFRELMGTMSITNHLTRGIALASEFTGDSKHDCKVAHMVAFYETH